MLLQFRGKQHGKKSKQFQVCRKTEITVITADIFEYLAFDSTQKNPLVFYDCNKELNSKNH